MNYSKEGMIRDLVLVVIVFGIVGIFNQVLENNKEYEPAEPNYYGLLKLGLIPNTYSRLPTEKDIDTGITISYQGNDYHLFESREFSGGNYDYGKYFVVRIN